MPARLAQQLARGVGIGLCVCAVLGSPAGAAAVGQPRSGEVRTPTVSGPVTGGKGLSFLGPDVSDAGYQRDEYFVEGGASGYEPVGALAADGKWRARASQTAPFKTRILVWKPTDPAKFNGTVYVEWLNVTAGFDSSPDWLMLHNQIVREGAAWVGVTAQAVGVRGGGNAIQIQGAPPPGGLKSADPERHRESSG
jgi:hypothetical protein